MANLTAAEKSERLSSIASDLDQLRSDLAFPVGAHLPITTAVLDRLDQAAASIRETIGDDTMAASAPLDEIEALTDIQRTALAGADIVTVADVRAASDEQLAAVDGIGPVAIGKLREATQEAS